MVTKNVVFEVIAVLSLHDADVGDAYFYMVAWWWNEGLNDTWDSLYYLSLYSFFFPSFQDCIKQDCLLKLIVVYV